MSKVIWKAQPDAHDYPAAAYLSLIATTTQVNDLVEQLKAIPIEHYKAKDILRSSGLRLLPPDNPHVAADLTKVKNNKALSPVLLIRGDLAHGIAVQIADGYTACAPATTSTKTPTSPAASPTTPTDSQPRPIPDWFGGSRPPATLGVVVGGQTGELPIFRLRQNRSATSQNALTLQLSADRATLQRQSDSEPGRTETPTETRQDRSTVRYWARSWSNPGARAAGSTCTLVKSLGPYDALLR